MAIDYGTKRVGIALTDPLRITSSAYDTLSNTSSLNKEIFDIVKAKVVNEIVVGIPYNQESQIGDSALKVLKFVKKLDIYFKENDLDIIFYGQDERYSTIDAYDTMNHIKVKSKKRNQLIDQMAAANILRSFLESGYKEKLNPGDIDG